MLTPQHAALFRHPNLRRLRLSYVDFISLENLPADYFKHPDLEILRAEACTHTPEAFSRLVSPTHNLKDVQAYHDHLPIGSFV